MIVPIVRSQISRLVCLSMFSPVSGPTGLRGHRRSPPLGCPQLLRRPGQLTIGLALAAIAAMLLLADWMPLSLVISLLVLGTFAFGLIAPNAMQGAMQPLPQIAGAAGAATGCIQMATGAVVSGLVATLNDEHSALSMTALMAACSLLGLVSYLLVARPAARVVIPS